MKKEVIKKDKNPDYVLIGLIVVLIIVLGVLVFTKIASRNTYKTDDELVVELHDYFSTKSLEDCNGLFNYSNTKVNSSEIDNATKLCVAYNKSNLKDSTSNTHNVDEKAKEDRQICTVDGMVFKADEGTKNCTVQEIAKNKINSTYKKIFGSDAEEIESFKTDSTHICYLKDDKYYCGLSEKFDIIVGNDVTVYRVVDSAKEDDGTLTMYDYFIRKVLNDCYNNYTTQDTNAICTKNLKGQKDLDYDFVKKYGVKYKHIYKKASDGSYYWVSSEPVENPNNK